MAKTIINLTDTLATLVTKTNTISNSLGDLAALTTSVDSDIVGSINSIYADVIADPIDSADVISMARRMVGRNGINFDSATGVFDIDSANVKAMISVTDAGGDGSLGYNASTGVLTYTGPSASEVRAHISAGEGIDISSGEISGEDASTSNKGVASFAAADFSVSSGAVSLVDIVSSHFGSPVTLTIYDSDGSTLKTIRSPGS